MLPHDDAAAAETQVGSSPEDHVEQWWDGAKEMSRLFQRSLGLQGPAWDVYLLYPPGARWKGEVPATPSFWMHQLSDPGAAPDLLLCDDPSRLARVLDQLLEE